MYKYSENSIYYIEYPTFPRYIGNCREYNVKQAPVHIITQMYNTVSYNAHIINSLNIINPAPCLDLCRWNLWRKIKLINTPEMIVNSLDPSSHTNDHPGWPKGQSSSLNLGIMDKCSFKPI